MSKKKKKLILTIDNKKNYELNTQFFWPQKVCGALVCVFIVPIRRVTTQGQKDRRGQMDRDPTLCRSRRNVAWLPDPLGGTAFPSPSLRVEQRGLLHLLVVLPSFLSFGRSFSLTPKKYQTRGRKAPLPKRRMEGRQHDLTGGGGTTSSTELNLTSVNQSKLHFHFWTEFNFDQVSFSVIENKKDKQPRHPKETEGGSIN